MHIDSVRVRLDGVNAVCLSGSDGHTANGNGQIRVGVVGGIGVGEGVALAVQDLLGAGDEVRLGDGVRNHDDGNIGSLVSSGIFLVMLLAMELAPALVLNLFDASAYMLEIGIPALRLLGLAWLISVPGAVLSSALQGLSMGTQSLILNTTRQTVMPLVFTLLFSQFGQLNWIWIALILVELLCLPLALFIWKHARHTLD